MQKRLREARVESLVRSVGRRNGSRKRRLLLLAPWRWRFSAGARNGSNGANPADTDRSADGQYSGNGHFGSQRLRRGHAEVDFHDRGEDVWKALRF